MKDSNMEIVLRLMEMAENKLEYSAFPKPYKEEHLFLANHLNAALKLMETRFDEHFQHAVERYKTTIGENKGYGWFENVENLIFENAHINQLKYAIYGEEYVHEYKFNMELGNDAYRDLILQIDRTVFMTASEKRQYEDELNKISLGVLDELLKEEKNKK